MVEKIYYSMGEITEMFDVEPTVIRYWCSFHQFQKSRGLHQIKPHLKLLKQAFMSG